MMLAELKNKKIGIVGMGVNNQKLAQYLQDCQISFEIIKDWQGHDELIGKLDNFDIIFRTPGLPFLSKAVQQAKEKGVVIYSQTKLFFDLCPCYIIGVTGTKGKGTTATLIARILEASALRPPKADQGRKVYLSGNIGADPFEFIDEIKSTDLVVLELSSFQLQDMHKSPHIAVVLKIFPEHLDYHKSAEEYINAKKPIVAYQQENDFAILNYDAEVPRSFAPLTAAKVIWNSTMREVKGCYAREGKIFLEQIEIMPISDVKLIGPFNLENVTAAIAAAVAAGVADAKAISSAVASFEGLPHRLEFVATLKGVKFYNDSFSTTPETTMAALSAFDAPIILIVGGSEKNSDYQELATTIAKSKIKTLIPIGITGPKIAKLSRMSGFEGKIVDKNFKNMQQIVEEANSEAVPGDAVLLSPASASFDMFFDYKHRGELFKKFVIHVS